MKITHKNPSQLNKNKKKYQYKGHQKSRIW